MKTPLIQARDRELLSAYLDDRLAPRERKTLETRLAAEPALQQELSELRSTVHALRSLPKLRVPRNYTLTPEAAGKPRRSFTPLFPVLRLATALATVLFAFVVGVDMMGRASPITAMTAPVEEPAAAELYAQATPAPEFGVAQAPSEPPAPEATPAPTEDAPALPADARSKSGTPESTAPFGGGGGSPPATESTPPSIAAVPQLTETPPGVEDIAPGAEAESLSAPATALSEPDAQRQAAPVRPGLLSLEIGLGALALLLGAATVWAWRSGASR